MPTEWIYGGLIFLVIVAAFFLAGSPRTSEDVCIATHRAEGRYRVLYNDGFLSQPFMRQTARDYAKMFGGRVVPRNYNGPHRVLPGGGWVNANGNA